ncbi:MAG: 4-hydroxythreonine-4-phosphate dehydrogenase 2 [Pseudomonadota bacterium]|jgi:4-hydroxythreonine-4-phosphate dehydrogenase
MTAPEPPRVQTIGLTLGDASGIGPEIVLKACAALSAEFDLRVIGDRRWLAREAARLGLPMPVAVDDVGRLPDDLQIGKIDPRAGQAAWQAIVHGARRAQAGDLRALVTAPISKEAMQAAGHDYPGHTELLAELAGRVPVRMMLAHDSLRVVLATIHLPLRAAIDRLDVDLILQTLLITDRALRQSGITRPRIAVAGLNPHAGEGGLFGREEIDIIAPAIAAARGQGVDAQGPYAPDTVFMRARGLQTVDAVIAMYHDQGLIPIKYLGLDEGVNITIGLPYVRTSPDHGTAFDIAGRLDSDGTGRANPASLIAAIRMAARMSEPRTPQAAASP